MIFNPFSQYLTTNYSIEGQFTRKCNFVSKVFNNILTLLLTQMIVWVKTRGMR